MAQAEARLSRGLADLNAAEVNYAISQAIYAQVIGAPPGRLAAADPIDRLLPRTREEALAIGRKDHPAILAAMYDTDVAQLGTKIAESSLWPNLACRAASSANGRTTRRSARKANDHRLDPGAGQCADLRRRARGRADSAGQGARDAGPYRAGAQFATRPRPR